MAAGDAAAVGRSIEFLALHTSPVVTVVRLRGAGAAAFNELIARDAGLVVLLEAGALVGPRWLELLTAALTRTGAGLAGPSTNQGPNEQACVAASADGSDPIQAVRRDALLVHRRFGPAVRTLAPLYSLGGFCYAVRRQVVDAIGTAGGHGWARDYNVRASRAGFEGIWVGGAYVCRTAPPRTAEPAPHPVVVAPRAPLVSCVMPTRNRPKYAERAALYFLRQDYPNAELVVVDDDGGLAGRLPADPRIRVLPGGGRSSIGALRNAGTAAAAGEIVVCWEDDDWHGPTRVSDQVAPIVAGTADLTGLAGVDWFEPATGRAWRLNPELHRRLLRPEVYGGTIAFRRSLWRRFPFPDRSMAEDALFLEQAVRGGARLARLDGAGRYVYVRHDRNSWRLAPDQSVLAAGWTSIPPPTMPAEDLAFYAGLTGPDRSSATPTVSCIMPTRNRRAYVALAIEYFLRQDYAAKELVILDDGDDSVGDLVPAGANIRYHRMEHRTVLGAKRNLACELAAGDLIAHWDDDDWHAPGRLSLQASRLTAGGAELCGAGSLLFWDPQRARAWRYTWPDGRRGWAAGTSLCYPKTLWRRTPFAEVPTGEDTRFVWQAAVRRLDDVRDRNCVVGLIHAANTVPKTGRGNYWSRAGISEVARCLGTDVKHYPAGRSVDDRPVADP